MQSRRDPGDVLRHMQEGHVPGNARRYGSIVAEPLTKEQLLKALVEIQLSEANMDVLLSMDGYEFPDGREQEAAEKCASELYSDRLLEHLNDSMKPVYAADTDMVDGPLSDTVMSEEAQAGHGIEFIPKVWPKPAVCVGSTFDGGGCFSGYTNYGEFFTYVDIDGGVFVTRCLSIYDNEDVVILRAQVLVEDGKDEYSLDGLKEFLPEEFKDFWDR